MQDKDDEVKRRPRPASASSLTSTPTPQSATASRSFPPPVQNQGEKGEEPEQIKASTAPSASYEVFEGVQVKEKYWETYEALELTSKLRALLFDWPLQVTKLEELSVTSLSSTPGFLEWSTGAIRKLIRTYFIDAGLPPPPLSEKAWNCLWTYHERDNQKHVDFDHVTELVMMLIEDIVDLNSSAAKPLAILPGVFLPARESEDIRMKSDWYLDFQPYLGQVERLIAEWDSKPLKHLVKEYFVSIDQGLTDAGQDGRLAWSSSELWDFVEKAVGEHKATECRFTETERHIWFQKFIRHCEIPRAKIGKALLDRKTSQHIATFIINKLGVETSTKILDEAYNNTVQEAAGRGRGDLRQFSSQICLFAKRIFGAKGLPSASVPMMVWHAIYREVDPTCRYHLEFEGARSFTLKALQRILELNTFYVDWGDVTPSPKVKKPAAVEVVQAKVLTSDFADNGNVGEDEDVDVIQKFRDRLVQDFGGLENAFQKLDLFPDDVVTKKRFVDALRSSMRPHMGVKECRQLYHDLCEACQLDYGTSCGKDDSQDVCIVPIEGKSHSFEDDGIGRKMVNDKTDVKVKVRKKKAKPPTMGQLLRLSDEHLQALDWRFIGMLLTKRRMPIISQEEPPQERKTCGIPGCQGQCAQQ